ncbi:hypothetical protein L1283_005666 [Sphingobacterium sp. HSC-15S19]
MTSSHKTVHFKSREFGCELLILNRRKNDEYIKVYPGTDRLRATSVRDRYPCGIDMSANGSLPGNIFQLKEKIRRSGHSRVAQIAAAGRGERPAKKGGR